MSTHFKKKSKTSQEIPTAAMPDIIFMLLIFFMVSTVLRETTVQVRTKLPQAEAISKIEQKRLVSYIWIGPRKLSNNRLGDTAVQIDDALIEDVGVIRTIMWRKLNETPKLIVSLRVDETSEMGIVLDVQQELREAGTLRINYSTKRLVAL
jgi:biopolymer transport protein ExbD